jgi:hypothetical protein
MVFQLAFAEGESDFLLEVDRASCQFTMEDIAMLPRKIPFSFFSGGAVPAIVAAIALIAVAPSVTTAATAAPAGSVSAAQQVSYKTSTATDISAAHRRHYARRGSVGFRRAFGSIIGGGPVDVPSFRSHGGYPGYGYGIGDNNRNRTAG